MLLNPVLSRRAGWMTALLLALSAAGATAGTLDPPAAPTDPASAMFTLTDLYNRLDAGTEGSKRGGSFVEPPDGAIAGTGYTLDQIMGLMPTLDNVTGAGVADVLEGKEFWGLTGGAWGLQTGTATAGASFDGGNGVKVITIPNGLYSGGKTATAIDSALDPANIKKGVTLFGTLGTFTHTGNAAGPDDLLLSKEAYVNGALVTGTVPAGASFNGDDGEKVITIPNGLYLGNKTATAVDGNLDSTNIKKNVTIFGVTGTYEPAASAPCTCSSTPTNGRWCDNGNGTVTDLLGATVAGAAGVRGRCLVWLKNAGWGGTKPWRVNAVGSYDDAHTRAGALSASDGTAGLSDGSVEGDWRLPTKVELQALTTDSSAGDKISFSSALPFTNVQSGVYWSSTTYPDSGYGSSYAWYVSPNDGNEPLANVKTSSFPYVWPVRGGL